MHTITAAVASQVRATPRPRVDSPFRGDDQPATGGEVFGCTHDNVAA